MASKVTPQAGADVSELDALLPQRVIIIAGEQLTVREYTLFDTLMLHDHLEPLIVSLAGMVTSPSVDVSTVMRVLASHAHSLPTLMAWAVDRDAKWVSQLSGTAGAELMDWWWSVNAHFFINAARRRLTHELAVLSASQEAASASPGSSPPSSPPDTTQTGSDITPTGN